MIVLAKGRENIILLKVNAAENLNGFSAVLAACGTGRTITGLSGDSLQFVFSSQDVAKVTESQSGEYGTLTIYDEDGKSRIKARPQFRLVDIGDEVVPAADRTIFISLPKKIDMADGGGGGGGSSQDLSNYATKTDLANAKSENKQYTDDKISDVGETIISEQKITVTEGGVEKEVTVQEVVQNVHDMKEALDKAIANSGSWEVKDEDGDGQPDDGILYFRKTGQ